MATLFSGFVFPENGQFCKNLMYPTFSIIIHANETAPVGLGHPNWVGAFVHFHPDFFIVINFFVQIVLNMEQNLTKIENY